jgi:hypothetical protein
MAELRRLRHVEFAAQSGAAAKASASAPTCRYCGPEVRATVECTDCGDESIALCAACDHRVHSFQGSEQLAAHIRVPLATETVRFLAFPSSSSPRVHIFSQARLPP